MKYGVGIISTPYSTNDPDQDMWLAEVNRYGEFKNGNKERMDINNHTGVIEVRGDTHQEVEFLAKEIAKYLNSDEHMFVRALALPQKLR